MGIEIKQLSKTFNTQRALYPLDLTIPDGELTVLLGPSGSGKTTLLRAIGGLELPEGGTILINGVDVTYLSPGERGIGFVFQNYALFQHMTVFENIAFGLKIKKRKYRPSKNEIKNRVLNLIKIVQLEGYEDRFPSQLSGGQCQRVALARALAIEPKVLLLDEPFAALDTKVRHELRRWIRKLHQELNLTTILVTHDQEEAMEIADKIIIMNEGKVQQIGTPLEVYQEPANPFVFRFLGRTNIIDKLEKKAFVRSHDIELHKEKSDTACLEAIIQQTRTIGAMIRAELKRADIPEFIEAEFSYDYFHSLNLRPNDRVFVSFKKVKYF
jgi:sulfate transport system ATP-binding protein